MSLSSLSVLILLASATAATAQTATPLDVVRACRHPAALPAEPDATAARLRAEDARFETVEPLVHLCTRMNAPPDLRSWRSVRSAWIAGLRPGAIPDIEELQKYADESDVVRLEWDRKKERLIASANLARIATSAVYFDTGLSEVLDSGRDSAVVRELAEATRTFLVQHPGQRVIFYGRADPTGDPAANQVLAERRAANLMQAVLRRGGIDAARVRSQGTAVIQDSAKAYAFMTNEPAAGVNTKIRDAGIGVSVGDAPVVLTAMPSALSAGVSSAAASSVAGNWAVALTDVVVEQAREQVTVYLIQRLAVEVCRNEIVALFPSVCLLFRNWEYRPNAVALRTAFASDLSDALVRHVRIGGTGTAHELERAFARAAVVFGLHLVRGEPAAVLVPAALDTMVQHIETPDLRAQIAQAREVYTLLLAARRDLSPGSEVSEHELVQATLRATAVNLLDRDMVPDYDVLAARVVPLLAAHRELETALREVRDLSATDTATRAHAVAHVVGSAFDVVLAALPQGTANPTFQRVQRIALPARDMATFVARGDYRNAVLQGTRLAVAASCPGSLTSAAQVVDCFPVNSAQQRVLTFAVDFTSATDQASMRAALQQYIGEGGGYMVKREGPPRSFVAINSYLGASGGGEAPLSTGGKGRVQAGAFLPVGVEFGMRGPPQGGWRLYDPRTWLQFFPSRSIFIQAVDLGAFAAARVGGDAEVPEPRLTQLLSPGAWFVGSVGRSPFSLGIGASLAPDAQVRSDGGGVTSALKSLSTVRFGIFVAADVPIFQLESGREPELPVRAPLPAALSEAADVTVTFRAVARFRASDLAKATHVSEIMQRVINSAEFRCRILSFDWRDVTRSYSPGCLQESVRAASDGSRTGFYWPAASNGEYGSPISNAQVYAALMAAIEVATPQEPPGAVNLQVALRRAFWHPRSIGATSPNEGIIRTDDSWFRSSPNEHVVGHWLHEYTHALGFTHSRRWSQNRAHSVPYATGTIACQLAAEMLQVDRGTCSDQQDW